MVTALKVSLTSLQYEQLLDTFRWLTAKPAMFNTYVNARISARGPSNLDDISEEDTGVTTLQMDPHVRAKLFPTISVPKSRNTSQKNISMKGKLIFFIFDLINILFSYFRVANFYRRVERRCCRTRGCKFIISRFFV